MKPVSQSFKARLTAPSASSRNHLPLQGQPVAISMYWLNRLNLSYLSRLLSLLRYMFQTNVGPILLAVNPYRDVGNPLTLTSTRNHSLSPQLETVVRDAVCQQAETGYPQAIILSGTLSPPKFKDSITFLVHCRVQWIGEDFRVNVATPAVV